MISCATVLVCLAPYVQANTTWVDKQHISIKETLHHWSNQIDHWLGTPDPSKPASASIRIMLDNEWNHYDGYSIKPRVRGKIKLPTLKQHLSLVFGDEDLDNQSCDKNQLHRNYKIPLEQDKKYDSKQSRDDNASLALRWSQQVQKLGIETDLDLGIRSGADIFLRFKLEKTWQHTDLFSTRLEQIYRYGINSKHYLRINVENKLMQTTQSFLNNHTFLEYRHDINEDIFWGNSLYKQYDFTGYKRLNYGLFVGGKIQSKKVEINYYGPFINWRQPIWREWLFIQPELHYYNNKSLDKKHHLGAFFRFEAIF
ncbi:hypothetical protein C5N92_10855 [Glaesserella australis]|uniref:Uncharacterized protein n=2 Tax=Pasteurellaceae TaxID=712 RepID=A0A328BW64_9PAST|nr:hypothetical protein CJD39_08750 [Glaesserella sp. 15-184]RAL17951.1 hypothetical protein C5N92_10855 [Glaesserella australis]